MIDVGTKSATSSPAPGRNRAASDRAHALSAEQESLLAARIKAGDLSAREELVLANMPLVRRIATAFRGHNRVVDLHDLIQEGSMGLLRAASDFDPEAHGTRFVNYAACWIRYRIRRVVAEQATTIRYPYYLVLLRRRFEKAREELIAASATTDRMGEPSTPDFEEILGRMGAEERELTALRNIRGELAARTFASISEPSHEAALARLIPPQEPVETAESMGRLHAGLRRLPLIQSWVLRRRYMLDEIPARAKTAGRAPSRRPGIAAGSTLQESRGRRTFRELSSEIGMPIHQLRAVERSALADLRAILQSPDGEPNRAMPVARATISSRRSA